MKNSEIENHLLVPEAENEPLGDHIEVETEEEDSTEVLPKSFDEIGLREEILRGIYAYGYENPSPIQQRAIQPMLTGRDIIAQAQSGTGKTCAFSLGVLQQIELKVKECQALILSPTRELAQQTERVVRSLGSYLPIKICYCVGGTATSVDVQALREGAQVVIGTPGRILQHLTRKCLRTERLKVLVLDEADMMLSKVQE